MNQHLAAGVTCYRLATVLLAAAVPLACGAAPAARVEFATGNPVAVSASGQSRAVAKGVQIDSGDTVNTNAGRVQLRFTDGAYVSLQPQSEFRIDDYRYDGKTDGSERGFFSLLKGGLRTITGLVGRSSKKNYQVTTTVATIGIRGTEYTIAYTNSITGSVGEGEINVCTGTGCVPFGSGQSFIVTDAASRPQLTSQKTDLPPQQPGDPPGGAFETANDSTKPNGQGQPSFVSGDQVTASGEPAGICGLDLTLCVAKPPPLTGTQPGMIVSKVAFGPGVSDQVTVVFDGKGVATMIDNVPIVNVVDAGNDGIIAWGRGVSDDDGPVYAHYVTALRGATLDQDISNLIAGNVVATYTLIGGTSPTGHAFSSTAPDFVGTLNSASVTVNFGSQVVSAAVGFNMAGLAFAANATGMALTGPQYSAANAATSCSASGGGSCTLNRLEGFVAGPQANRTGFTYEILTPSLPGASSATINGAVALGR